MGRGRSAWEGDGDETETDGDTFGAQLTASGNVRERRVRNAKFQVLTALFVRSEVLWGK